MEIKKTIHRLRIEKNRIFPDVLEVGTEGSVGFDYLEPDFSREWDGLQIKAVFHPKRGKPIEVAYVGKPVMVPTEIMRYFGDGSVIFSGYKIIRNENGDVEFPKLKTVPCQLKVLHTMDDKGGNTIPDTPGMYEQLREAFLEDLKNGIEDALEQAKKSGEFDGPAGPPGVGLPGPPGIYMLKEGETLDDVPPEYDAAIDPFNEEEIVIFDRGIIAIYRTAGTGKPGEYDTYTIFYSDNTSTEYQVYNGSDGKNFVILGYYETLDALESAVPEPEPGMAYGVGTEAPYDVYVYDGVNGVWVNNGQLSGVPGENGADGKSVEMQVSSGYIQWRQEGGEWINLVALTSLEGKGILTVDKTSTEGNVDTYTITFSDNSASTFTVTNAKDITVAEEVTEDGTDPVSGAAVAAYVNQMIYGFLNGSS